MTNTLVVHKLDGARVIVGVDMAPSEAMMAGEALMPDGLSDEEMQANYALAASEGATFTKHSKLGIWKWNTNGTSGLPKRSSGFTYRTKDEALFGFLQWKKARKNIVQQIEDTVP